ncbi:unnamed protein product [Pylaiella littoralis]
MEWPQHQSNSTGVFLEITEGRSLYFTPRETLIFGYLFDLADTDDDGLVGANDGGHALLGRARLPPSTLQRLWLEAGGESPEECLARPQWFVLLGLVALAQAGLPCTLRDLLNTCDVVSSPPAQLLQQQQQQQYGSGNGNSNSSAGRLLRPIPDFFLDGGVPPALSTSPSPSPSVQAGGEQQQQRRPRGGGGGGGGRKSGKGQQGGAPGSRGQLQGKVEAWGYGGGGGEDGPGGGTDGGAPGAGGEGGDGYQLEVTVYSHRVVGEGYGSHTEYTVLANASLPGFARREMEVARRFSDFRWLHRCFQAIPGVLPPPLPPSKWAGSSSRDFVAERMKGLQRYITRVAQHPILSRHYAFQVFLEGTPRGLRAAKALLPARAPGTNGNGGCCSGHGHGSAAARSDTFSPSMAGGGGTPVSPALSSTPSTTPPDESSGGFVRRRFCLGGADDMLVPGGGAGGVTVTGLGAGVGGGAGARQGKRRSVSFGASSDDGSCHGGAGSVLGGGVGSGGGGGWAGSATGWPLSVVANVGYEAYGNYMSTSVSTSLTSIKGVFGAVKTKAKSVVGLGAGPAPITVEQDPLYEAEVSRIEELVTPVAGAVKVMESAAVLKRGVGYEMSRLGHYLTQVASLEDTDGLPPGGIATEEAGSDGGERVAGGAGTREGRVAGGVSAGGGGGSSSSSSSRAGWAKAEQVLGQRMERVATAWLEAIDQEESDFLDPLREQLGYLASAKEVHRGRGRALDALQQAGNASLQRNKQRLHAARAQGDAHMASVSTGKMEAAEARMTCAHTRAGLITKTFKDEARRFHECRRAESVLAVLELARAQALFARKANAAWKQVLEDINPTDDELRESQQRVRLPKREAVIAEGGRRAGGSTAGVIGGWLGAAATVGLSTASAGLSTVTGVAGATASAGLSTVTGVAGAMSGLAVGAGAAIGARKGEEAVGSGLEDGGVAVSGGGGDGAAAAAAAAPTPVGTVVGNDSRGLDFGPVSNSNFRAEDGDGGRGGTRQTGLHLHGAGLASLECPPSVPPVPMTVSSGDVGRRVTSRSNDSNRVEEENTQLQDVDVETSTVSVAAPAPAVAAAVIPPSTRSRQLTDGSWELNIEQPPPGEAVAEQTANPSADPSGGNAEAKSEEKSILSPLTSTSRPDGNGLESSPGVGGLSKPANNRAKRQARRGGAAAAAAAAAEAAAAAAAAKRSESSDGSSNNKEDEDDDEDVEEGWAGAGAAGWPASTEGVVQVGSDPEGNIAGQLVSLSLDEKEPTPTTTVAPSSSSSSSPPPEPAGNTSARSLGSGLGVSDGRSGATTSTPRGPATALSLMDSLEALSSSGADSVPEAGGDDSGGARKEGERNGDDDDGTELSLLSSPVAVAGGKSKAPAAGEGQGGGGGVTTTNAATTTSTSASSSNETKKKGRKGLLVISAAGVKNTAAGGASGGGGASEAGELKSKPTTPSADGGTIWSGGSGTDPATGSGSGSGSISGGSRTVSAGTTVVRLAGSPNPPLQRDGGGSGGSGSGGVGVGSSGAWGGTDPTYGLRRLAPNGGRGRGRGRARGRLLKP